MKTLHFALLLASVVFLSAALAYVSTPQETLSPFHYEGVYNGVLRGDLVGGVNGSFNGSWLDGEFVDARFFGVAGYNNTETLCNLSIRRGVFNGSLSSSGELSGGFFRGGVSGWASKAYINGTAWVRSKSGFNPVLGDAERNLIYAFLFVVFVFICWRAGLFAYLFSRRGRDEEEDHTYITKSESELYLEAKALIEGFLCRRVLGRRGPPVYEPTPTRRCVAHLFFVVEGREDEVYRASFVPKLGFCSMGFVSELEYLEELRLYREKQNRVEDLRNAKMTESRDRIVAGFTGAPPPKQ